MFLISRLCSKQSFILDIQLLFEMQTQLIWFKVYQNI